MLIAEDRLETQQLIIMAVLRINPMCEIYTAVRESDGWEIAQEHQIHLFILDIELIDSTGFELADRISESQKYFHVPVVFETINPRPLLRHMYKYQYINYIVKPFTMENLLESFIPIFEIIYETLDRITYIEVKDRHMSKRVSFDEVIYISAFINGSIIHTEKHTYSSEESLKSLIEKIDERFIQCHKSYIVNMFCWGEINNSNDTVQLKGINKEIPIGRTFKKDVYYAHIHFP